MLVIHCDGERFINEAFSFDINLQRKPKHKTSFLIELIS